MGRPRVIRSVLAKRYGSMVAIGDQIVQTTVSGFQSPSGVFLPVTSN